MLARIVQMVAEAQRSRAPIQRLADQVSGWFVPSVILVALAAFIAWSLFGPNRAWRSASLRPYRFFSSLPVPARWAWRRRCRSWWAWATALQAGVLIKHAEALERMEKVDTIVATRRER